MPAEVHIAVDLDDLLIGSHILSALEVGRFRMHPSDYFEIAGWVSGILHRLPTAALRQLRREAPRVLAEMAENALGDRGESLWPEKAPALDDAGAICADALTRARRSA